MNDFYPEQYTDKALLNTIHKKEDGFNITVFTHNLSETQRMKTDVQIKDKLRDIINKF